MRGGRLAVFVLVAACLAPSSGAQAATTTPPTLAQSVAFQANAAHDGRIVEPGLNPPLVKKWSRQLSWDVSYPLIADAKVFVTTPIPLAEGGSSRYGTQVWALSACTGATVWGPVAIDGVDNWTRLTYGGGRVFALDGGNRLHAFDAATGAKYWTVPMFDQPFADVSPTYSGGIVYTVADGSGITLHAVSAETGGLIWSRPVGANASAAVGTLNVAASAAYVTEFCATGSAFDPVSGETLWSGATPCSGGGSDDTVLAHGLLWAPANLGGHVLLAGTGEFRFKHNSVTPPAFDATQGYFREGSALVARTPETMAHLWTFAGDGNLSAAPLVVNDHVYVGSTSGMLYAVNAATGVATWSENVGAPINQYAVSGGHAANGFAAGNGLVVVPASDMLVAYGTESGPPTPAPARTLAFGWNGYGMVGDGTTTSRFSPVDVAGLGKVRDVAAGMYHTVVAAADGTVRTWGWNGYGQLGDGTTTTRDVPVVVPGLTDVVAVAAGAYHSLALKSDGTIWAWGFNALGQLGDGTTIDRHTPVPIAWPTDAVAIAAGNYHSLALRPQGSVVAWGWNGFGQLGDGTTEQRNTPQPVSLLSEVKSISAGAYHSLAAMDGTAYAWGWNGLGQLGDGTTAEHHVPQPMQPAGRWVTGVAAGTYHSLVLYDDGTVQATGWNGFGVLGDWTSATTRTQLVPVYHLRGVVKLDAGFIHNLAITADGRVWAWGWGGLGGIGGGRPDEVHYPVLVPGLYSVSAVAAGFAFSVAT